MRATLVFFGWLLAINLWLAIENIHDLSYFDSAAKLEITVCFIYTAIPLAVALLVSRFGFFRFHRAWCAILSGLICGGVVLTFFVVTEQLDLGSIGWVATFTLAGASIGFIRRIKRRDA